MNFHYFSVATWFVDPKEKEKGYHLTCADDQHITSYNVKKAYPGHVRGSTITSSPILHSGALVDMVKFLPLPASIG